jgi:hypothetical protein
MSVPMSMVVSKSVSLSESMVMNEYEHHKHENHEHEHYENECHENHVHDNIYLSMNMKMDPDMYTVMDMHGHLHFIK